MREVQPDDDWSFPVERRDGVAILTFPSDAYNRIEDPVARATFLVQAQQEIEALVEQSDQPRLLIDFNNVATVTSGLLGILVQMQNMVNDRGGQFHIAGLQAGVCDVFSLTQLDKVLTLHPTVDDALKGFAES